MSLIDYRQSQEIASRDYYFSALIMAAMRKADSDNALILSSVFPEIWDELRERYNLPEGLYPHERVIPRSHSLELGSS